VLQRVTEGEEEEQERPLQPLAQHRRSRRGHQHEEVNLEVAHPEGVDGLPHRVVPAEDVPADVKAPRPPRGEPAGKREPEPDGHRHPGGNREDKFRLLAENATVVVPVVLALLFCMIGDLRVFVRG